MWNFILKNAVGSELFHADRRKEIAKLTVAFRNSSKSAKNNKAVSLFHRAF